MSTVHNTNTTAAPNEAVTEAFARWKKTVEAELKGAPFDKKLVTRTFEGVALQPLYTSADLSGLPDLASRPGQAPFLRGKHADGYKQRPWEVAQEIAASTPEAFNKALVADLMRGQDSVVLAPNCGADSLTISNLKDLSAALANVDLGAVPVHMDAGAEALSLASLYVAHARKQKTNLSTLTGSVTADPVGEWVRNGRLSQSVGDLYDELAGWTSWAAKNAPELRTIGVNARIWADAGGTAVHELAFALAAAVDYLRALKDRGVENNVAASRIRFQFAVGPQFFTEIAKFRAFRSLWTRVLVAFGLSDEIAARATVHVATCRWNKTRLDPHVNMLRVTTEALSAVLGGCDSLNIAPFDEVMGSSDDFSRRIARNVHTLLAEEFSFTQAADPAGGSWYVEKLTDELARKAWALFQSVEAKGGYTAALREGMPQALVTEAVKEKTDAVGKRRLGLIGTNLFPNLKEKPLATQAPAAKPAAAKSTAAAKQLEKGASWQDRFAAAVEAATAGADIAQGRAETFPPEWTITAVQSWRASAGFEQLRAASDSFAQRTGKRPRVFLAKMGPALQHKARADFSAGFFAAGGFEIVAKQSFETAADAAKAAAESGAPVAVLCSTDETYPALVPEFAGAVKAATGGKVSVVLAGMPAEAAVVESFRAAGVDEFIHIRASVYAVLAKFLKQIGALV